MYIQNSKVKIKTDTENIFETISLMNLFASWKFVYCWNERLFISYKLKFVYFIDENMKSIV